MKLQNIVLSLCFLALSSPVLGQDDADFPNLANDDANTMVQLGQADQGLTDSDAPPIGTEVLDTKAYTPIAFGVAYSNGQKKSGTSNWTSGYKSALKRYEITISGETYYYLNYTTTITPAGDSRYCKSSSVGGKLLVYCYDKNGNPATSRFGFVTFKAP